MLDIVDSGYVSVCVGGMLRSLAARGSRLASGAPSARRTPRCRLRQASKHVAIRPAQPQLQLGPSCTARARTSPNTARSRYKLPFASLRTQLHPSQLSTQIQTSSSSLISWLVSTLKNYHHHHHVVYRQARCDKSTVA